MNVHISSDSTCDLSLELLRRYGISITPLSVCCGEKIGADGTEITPQDIYDYVSISSQRLGRHTAKELLLGSCCGTAATLILWLCIGR